MSTPALDGQLEFVRDDGRGLFSATWGDGLDEVGQRALLRELEGAQDGLWVLVLGGTGWVFERGDSAAQLVQACAELPFPVIAWFDGPCHEEGLELALACDIRVGSPRSSFRMSQVREGRIPAAGGTQRLPRLAGPTLANRMILLCEEIDADEGLTSGLVSEVVAEPQGHALRLASAISGQGPLAEVYAKEAIGRGAEMPLEQALRYETDLTVILQSTADRAEGVRAFLEKREPEFREE